MAGNLVAATLKGGLYTRVVGRRLLFFQEIGSTMDEAARQAAAGAEEGTVVVAENQTAGRGRQGREWVSRRGNLYLSVVFRPSRHTLPLLTVLSAVATVRAIRKTTGLEPRIKWPNDVQLDSRKVAGVLVESVMEGDTVRHAIAGIGINVNLETDKVDDIAGFATALNAAAVRPVAREAVLRQLLQELDSLYLQTAQGGSPLAEWRGLLETLGQRVRAYWGNETHVGQAEDVDSVGNLLLRLEDGRRITLTAGDVTLHGLEP